MPTIDFSELDIDPSEGEEESTGEDKEWDSAFSTHLKETVKGSISETIKALMEQENVKDMAETASEFVPPSSDESPSPLGYLFPKNPFTPYSSTAAPESIFGHPVEYVHHYKDPHISGGKNSNTTDASETAMGLSEKLNKGDEIFKWDVTYDWSTSMVIIRLAVLINGKKFIVLKNFSMDLIASGISIPEIKAFVIKALVIELMDKSINDEV